MNTREVASTQEISCRPAYILYNELNTLVERSIKIWDKRSKFFTTEPEKKVWANLDPLTQHLDKLHNSILEVERNRAFFKIPALKQQKLVIAQEKVSNFSKKISQLIFERDQIEDNLREQSRQINEQLTLSESDKRSMLVEATTERLINLDDLEAEITNLNRHLRDLERKIDGHCCGCHCCNKADIKEAEDLQYEIQIKERKLKELREERNKPKPENPEDLKKQALKKDLDSVNQKIRDHIKLFPEKIEQAKIEKDAAQKQFERKRIKYDSLEIDFNSALSISLMLDFLKTYIYWIRFQNTILVLKDTLSRTTRPDPKNEQTKIAHIANIINDSTESLHEYFNLLWCYESEDLHLPDYYQKYVQLTLEDQEKFLSGTKNIENTILPKQPGIRISLLRNQERVQISAAPLRLLQTLRKKEEKIAQAQTHTVIPETLRVYTQLEGHFHARSSS